MQKYTITLLNNYKLKCDCCQLGFWVLSSNKLCFQIITLVFPPELGALPIWRESPQILLINWF